MNINIIKTAIAFCLSTMMWSCSESKDEIDDNFIKEVHLVNGKVEKGPMVRGSSIEMRTLNKKLVPNGSSYTTTIENNNGEFNFGSLEVSSPYAKLTADGYFFNEVRGQLSNSTIKLDAFVDLTDNTSINVNILTHLKSQRINNLVVKAGKDFKEANEQAQKELLTQFGLQHLSTKDASQFSITSGDDAAGVLIAVSSLILVDRSEAQIVEFISQLTNDFASTGQFTETTKKALIESRNSLNDKLEQVADNIHSRYQEFGKDVTIKDLQYFFDWDGDGIAGNDVDASSTVELSQNAINVPSEGGNYSVTIKSDKVYYLECPNLEYGPNYPSYGEDVFYKNFLYETGYTEKGIEFDKSLSGNTVTIKVAAAQFRKAKETTVNIYNARGKCSAIITIKQDGNPTKPTDVPNLSKEGLDYMASQMSVLNEANEIIQRYENTFVASEYKRPFESYDTSAPWTRYYSFISRMAQVKEYDENELGCYQPYFNVYMALAHLKLSSYWSRIVYVDRVIGPNESYNLYQSEERELLQKVIALANEAMEDLDEKRNDSFTSGNTALFVSKDVARVIKAYAACNLKDYSTALSTLETVINNGYYHLVKKSKVEFANDSECILGTKEADWDKPLEDAEFIPCLDYVEVLLTAAECNYNLGHSDKAWQYIQQVCDSRSWLNVGREDLLTTIYNVRTALKLPNTLPFVRRNGIATKVWDHFSENEEYMLIWPIPSSEIMSNPHMTQNPGY